MRLTLDRSTVTGPSCESSVTNSFRKSMASKIVSSPDGLRTDAGLCVEDIAVTLRFPFRLAFLSERGAPNLSRPFRDCMHGVRHPYLYNLWCPAPVWEQGGCQAPFCLLSSR